MNLDVELNANSIKNAVEKLKEVQRNMEEAEKPKSYTLKELFPSDFMEEYTNCKTIKEFIENSGLDFSHEANEVFCSDKFSKYVSENSKFTSWEEMKNHAAKIILSNNIIR